MTHPIQGPRVFFAKRRRRKDRRLLERLRALVGMGRVTLAPDGASSMARLSALVRTDLGLSS